MNRHRIIKLIAELVEDTYDSSVEINRLLMKTMVLAHKLSNNPLKEWCHKEINGYGACETTELPEYRIIKCTPVVKIQSSNGLTMSTFPPRELDFLSLNNDIPSDFGMSWDELYEKLSTLYMRESANNFSHWESTQDHILLACPLPEKAMLMLFPPSSMVTGTIVSVQYASMVSKSTLAQITASARVKLLGFLMDLESDLEEGGDLYEARDELIKERARKLFTETIHIKELIMGDSYKQNADVIQGIQGPKGTMNVTNNAPVWISNADDNNEFLDKVWRPGINSIMKAIVELDSENNLISNGSEINVVEAISVTKKLKELAPSNSENVAVVIDEGLDEEEKLTLKSIFWILLTCQLPVLQGIEAAALFEVLKIWLGA